MIKILFADNDIENVSLLMEGFQDLVSQHMFMFERVHGNVKSTLKKFKPDIAFIEYETCALSLGPDPKSIQNNIHQLGVPVIICSDSLSRRYVTSAFQSGAARYLVKPIEYISVIKGIETILDLYYSRKLKIRRFDEFVIDAFEMRKGL